jgi:hypothetical protein
MAIERTTLAVVDESMAATFEYGSKCMYKCTSDYPDKARKGRKDLLHDKSMEHGDGRMILTLWWSDFPLRRRAMRRNIVLPTIVHRVVNQVNSSLE